MNRLFRSRWVWILLLLPLVAGVLIVEARDHSAGAEGNFVAVPHCAFVGLVTERPEQVLGQWQVNDVPLLVDKSCQIDQGVGEAVVGAWVSVAATCPSGEVRAYNIKVITSPTSQRRKFQFRQAIEEIHHDYWVIGGSRVRVTGGTRIEGTPVVNAPVQVEAEETVNGLVARRIVILNPADIASEVSFSGTVQEIHRDWWLIDGLRVDMTPATVVRDHIQVGQVVDVQAKQEGNGHVEAKMLALALDKRQMVHFSGWVNSMRRLSAKEQLWQVAVIDSRGQISDLKETVVDQQSAIDEQYGVARVGAWVDVGAVPQSDSAMYAQVVRVEAKPAVYFSGIVQQMPKESYLGYWQVADMDVEVNKQTLVIGDLAFQAGQLVSIQGKWAADGHVVADMIVHAGQ